MVDDKLPHGVILRMATRAARSATCNLEPGGLSLNDNSSHVVGAISIGASGTSGFITISGTTSMAQRISMPAITARSS